MTRFLALVLMALSTAIAPAADWPQWLGAKRDGNTPEKVEPWKDLPKELWQAKVGAGFSAPVVANGRVFIHAKVGSKEREEVIAFDVKTGKELWRTPYDRAKYSSVLNTGPQATPAVSGGKVYSFGITGVLSCLDAESGKLLWQKDTFKDAKATLPRFGVCCSPLVIGNRVVVAVGGKGSSVAAFDTKNGDLAWQALDEPANTSSPFVYAAKGKAVPDAVFMTTLRVVGLNPLDGSVSWEFPLPFQPSGTAPTPLLAGDLAITTTMDNGATAIKLTGGEKTTAEKAWQAKEQGGYFSTGVAGKDRVFLVTNTLKPVPRADLSCLNLATGKLAWRKEAAGYFHVGVIRTANDKLLVLDDTGTLKMLDATAAEYRELCEMKVCDGSLVTPAFADGCLFARGADALVCVRLVPQ